MPVASSDRVKSIASRLPERLRAHNLTLVAAGVAFYGFLAFVLDRVQALSFIPIPDQLLTYLVQKAPPGLLTWYGADRIMVVNLVWVQPHPSPCSAPLARTGRTPLIRATTRAHRPHSRPTCSPAPSGG